MPDLPKRKAPYWNPPKPKHHRAWANPWYNTGRWQKLSKQVRYIDYPVCNAPHLCVLCKRNLCTTADHKKPVVSGKDMAEREALMWDIINLQPVCDTCHAKKSASEQ